MSLVEIEPELLSSIGVGPILTFRDTVTKNTEMTISQILFFKDFEDFIYNEMSAEQCLSLQECPKEWTVPS